MRTAVLVTALLAIPLALAACHGHDGFDTLQACYDEHTNVERLPVQDAIVVCCLDHPVQGVNPSCRDSQADCVAHVDAELDASVSLSDIQMACTTYINER